jgi:hypothetical protein
LDSGEALTEIIEKLPAGELFLVDLVLGAGHG